MTKAQLQKSVDRLTAIDAKCKELYAERDRIEAGLIAAVEQSDAGAVRLSDGRTIGLKDNFVDRDGARRNVAFKTAAVKRFELVVSQPA